MSTPSALTVTSAVLTNASLKASMWMTSTPLGIVREASPQRQNAFSPIDRKVEGRTTSVRDTSP